MSALDKIIDGILRQAGEKADAIIAEANRQADAILKKGEADRAERERQLIDTTERECAEVISRAQAADRRSRKLALLEARNQAIGEVLAEAKAKLAQITDPERFSVIWQGDILLNNSIEAVFEADEQSLRDRAYEALTAEGGE